MEKKFLSGLSLFDFLAMVIPGGLIIAIIGYLLGYKPFVIDTDDSNGFFAYLIVLVASYLVGLVWNTIMYILFFKFRNCPRLIKRMLNKIIKEHRGKIYITDGEIKCTYYEAYYYVATHSINASISIMESQVAFIRNMVIPLAIVTARVESFFHLSMNVCCVRVWMIIVIVLMIIVMFLRQYKIYRRVWEDYIFLKRLEKSNR